MKNLLLYTQIVSLLFSATLLSSCQNKEHTDPKIPEETIKLLKVQKDLMVKQLINFPDLYFTKSHYPLEISQRAFNHLWRMCESYELWCKETKQDNLIILDL